MRFGLVAIVFLLFLGCISQQTVDAKQVEITQSAVNLDIDEDNEDDVWVYTFTPATSEDAGIKTQRTLIAYKEVELGYLRFEELSDQDALSLIQSFEDFENSVEMSTEECLRNTGLVGVNCIDVRTCAQLCSSSSLKCKKLVEEHEAIIGDSVLRYGQYYNELEDALYSSARSLVDMANEDRDDVTYLVSKLQNVLNNVYALEANPLIQSETLLVCSANIYDNTKLQDVINGLGTPVLQTETYRYTIFLQVLPSATKQDTLSQREITVQDRLPRELVEEEDLYSPLDFSSNTNTSGVFLSFDPIRKLGGNTQMITYSFSSQTPPEILTTQLKRPSFALQVLNLEALGLSAFLFDALKDVLGNLYIAFGLALSVFVILLLLLLLILGLIYSVLRAVLAKEKAMVGIRKSLLRTTVRWKTDLLLGLILTGAGIAASYLFASKNIEAENIFVMGNIVLGDAAAFIASSGVFFGSILLYLAIQNKVKVFLLEDIYQKELGEDKDIFVANVKQLKEQWNALRTLAESLRKENFDVRQEYNVVAGLSEGRIVAMGKKFDDTSKQNVQQHLIEVEDALERLREKKRRAESNWPQWKANIEKLLEENEKVHRSQLIGIPGTLQIWALHRFAKEYGEKDIVFQGETIVQKKLSPDRLVQRLFDQGIFKALVVTKNEKIVLSKTAKGSSSVIAALTVKLMGYVKTMLPKLGHGGYSSLAGIGTKSVLLISKEHGLETLLIVPREKFKEALQAWKEKGKRLA